jgi:hypothetical protein
MAEPSTTYPQILSEACQEYPGWRSWQIMASGFHQVSYSSFAMQALFEHSNADYVIFLDADECPLLSSSRAKRS